MLYIGCRREGFVHLSLFLSNPMSVCALLLLDFAGNLESLFGIVPFVFVAILVSAALADARCDRLGLEERMGILYWPYLRKFNRYLQASMFSIVYAALILNLCLWMESGGFPLSDATRLYFVVLASSFMALGIYLAYRGIELNAARKSVLQ